VRAPRPLRRIACRCELVLLDLWLPDSNDLSVLSAIHGMAPATRIILMTAHGNEDLFDEGRRRGAFIAVDKPFDIAVLPSLIAAALASLYVH
jgi:two-component system repressor protein LuxO